MDSQIEAIINDLYANNAYKLQQMCQKVMSNFGGISQKDYDDFYSRVGYEITIASKNFDSTSGKTFIEYLYGVITLAICKEMTYRNRKKRQTVIEKNVENGDGSVRKIKEYVSNISIDTPIGEEDGLTIGDTLHTNTNIENELLKDKSYGYSENMEQFLDSLPDLSRKIAEMIMEDYSTCEIKTELRISDKQYQDSWKIINSYDKKRILYKDNYDMEVEKMDTIITTEDVAESYKNTSYSIESISKQLKKRLIRDDHILQRHSGQWKSFAKSELVSTILRGKSLTQIIISEEIKNGVKMQWLIDGKQRCSTLDDYLHDGFAVSKNAKNYSIRYPAPKTDENGNEVFNDEGFPVMEYKVFDIRGKKFSQLPEELQDIFKDRQIPVLYNMNCTKKDIAEDIARFNRSRPMNKAQNGWLGLDEEFAEFVDNISKMAFFQPTYEGSKYTNNNFITGTIRRLIVEGIMVSDFIDEYCKDFDKMCEYLTDEASDSNFTDFYSLIERLTVVSDESVSHWFNAKDSFLFFGLFSRFTKYDIDDSRFIDFLKEFDTSLHSKKINGISFDDMDGKSTKDKTVVIEKMNHLEALMIDFIGINETNKKTDLIQFVKENVDPNITKEDLEFQAENLNSWTIGISESSRLFEEKNKPSMISMAMYIFKNGDACDDETIIDWFIDFEKRNKNYIQDQKENYLHMKNDFELYIKGSAGI